MDLPFPDDGFPLSWSDIAGWIGSVPKLVWVVLAIALVVAVGLGLTAWVLPDRYTFKTKKPLGPVDGPPARAIAVAAPVLMGDHAEWNDIGGVYLTPADRKRVIATWGIGSPEQVTDVMERLLSQERFDARWHRILRARRSLAISLGRQPLRQEWVKAAAPTGTSNIERTAIRESISHVLEWERMMRRISHKRVGHTVLRENEIVTDISAYSMAQAAAVTIWAAALGIITAEQAAGLRDQVVALQKQRFANWREFGQSFLLGRAINAHHLTDGSPEKVNPVLIPSILDIARLQSQRKKGPWTTIAW